MPRWRLGKRRNALGTSAARLAVASALGAGLVIGLAGPASAHETRTVGAYNFTVGWKQEPTYVGVQNAVQLFVHDAQGKALDDIGDNLKVAVLFGSQQSAPLDLAASFDPDTGLGTHGEFDAAIIPTQPGNYTFHFTGSIGSQQIDQRFTSSDTTFDTVKVPTGIEFPTQDPTAGQLATSISRIDPRVSAAKTIADSASSSASTAKTLGIIGIVTGVVLGGAGLATGLSSRRRRTT